MRLPWLFLAFMEEHGLELEHGQELVYGKKYNSCRADGKSGAGRYTLYDDGWPAGAIWNFHNGGEKITWKFPKDETARRDWKPKAEYRAERQKKRQEDTVKAKRAAVEREAAQKKAEHEYSTFKPATAANPYLASKGLEPRGDLRQAGQTLIVPLRDVTSGAFTTFQNIYPTKTKAKNGETEITKFEKRFKGGVESKGGVFTLDATPGASLIGVILAEGIATALSIFDALEGRYTVLCACTSGNLALVTKAVRAKYSDIPLFIAQDDDAAGAKAASAAMGAGFDGVLIPPFTDEELGSPVKRPSDWDDFRGLRGMAAAGLALKATIEEARQTPKKKGGNVMTGTDGAVISWNDVQATGKPEGELNWPDLTRRKTAKATIANLEYLLSTFGVKVFYDEIAKKISYSFRGGNKSSVDNRDNASYAQIYSLMKEWNGNTDNLKNYLLKVADDNRQNPVKNWITSATWDGVDRIEALGYSLETTPDFPYNLKMVYLRKWLLSAVAAACHDGKEFMARGVLTLAGRQGIGKTRWISALAPKDFILSGAILDPSNKDSVTTAISHWIVELGELESSFRRDIGRLKGFISLTSDKIRRPYAADESSYPRRTVFAASVNGTDFLKDEENTRFLVIPVLKADPNHGLPMQQVFAQVYQEDYLSGAEWWLSAEETELQSKINAIFEERDEIYDLLLEKIDWSDFGTAMEQGWVMYYSPTEVLMDKLSIKDPSKQQRNACAKWLRKLTGIGRGKHTETQKEAWPIPNGTPK